MCENRSDFSSSIRKLTLLYYLYVLLMRRLIQIKWAFKKIWIKEVKEINQLIFSTWKCFVCYFSFKLMPCWYDNAQNTIDSHLLNIYCVLRAWALKPEHFFWIFTLPRSGLQLFIFSVSYIPFTVWKEMSKNNIDLTGLLRISTKVIFMKQLALFLKQR